MGQSRHLVIAGTGRAGTTFLVTYLGACGLDTGAEELGYADRPRAGLERSLLHDRSTYVVKDPWFYEIAPLLDLAEVAVDGVIIPVRDLRQAAASRVRIEMASLVERGYSPHRFAFGHTAGGVVYPLDIDTQMKTLAMGQALLLQWCVEHSIEVVFLDYPRLVNDGGYLVDRLAPFLPDGLDRAEAIEIFDRVSAPSDWAKRNDGGADAAGDEHEEEMDGIRISALELLLGEAQARVSALEAELAEQRGLNSALSAEADRLREDCTELRHSAADLAHQLEETSDALSAARTAMAAALEAQAETLRELTELRAANEILANDAACVRSSEAYRAGMAVTWPARNIKRLLSPE